MFLTGAIADGGAQAVPASSLGGFRSSTRAGGLPFYLNSLIAGLSIDFVAAANGIGSGTLHVVDDDSLAWAPPGGAYGAAVTILPASSAIIEGTYPDRFISVTRNATQPLAGFAALQILDSYNEVIGQSDGTLPEAKTYRCICLKNGPTQQLTNLKIWIAHADNPIQIALENPSAQPSGSFQTIANQSTAPVGVTFVAPTSPTDPAVITIANLPANNQIGLWIARDLTSAQASPQYETSIAWQFTAVG